MMSALFSSFTIAKLRKGIASNSVPVLTATLAATNIIRLGSNLILTRLLAPEAFGVVGVIVAINFFLQMTTDMGFGAFIIRAKEGITKHLLNVIWTVRLVRNCILCFLMFAFAGPFAGLFDKPALEAPIRVASFLIILQGLRSMHPYVAQRAQRISYISVVEFGVFLGQILITIIAAIFIRSYWAMIIGILGGGVVNAVVSYIVFPGGLHRLAFDKKTGRELWRFARVIAASSSIMVILSQADKIFIGRALSLDAFGLYMLAVNLTGAAQRLIFTYVNKILFPLYAEAYRRTPDDLFRIYYSARRKMTFILAFLLGGGAGGGELIVRILLDERYLGAGVYVSLLCFGALFLLATKPAENLLFAMGRIRTSLEGNIVRLAWIAIAAPLALHYFGVIGLVAAFALIEMAAAIFWWAHLIGVGAFNLREELAWLSAAAIGGSIGITAEWFAEYLIRAGYIQSF